MRVLEKGTDRTAYVHIFAKGRVNPLEEYGQYVDARDKAVCCYVAVEEGHEIKVDGRFNGLTLSVAYDCIVDGVCRKSNSYAGKSVQVQKHKKLDVDTFLYQLPDGVIDTQMSVTPYTGTTSLGTETPETIGTIELRVYVTRQLDVEHVIDDACAYDKVKEDSDPSSVVATYKDVPPQYHMSFEKDCPPLETSKGKREMKKVRGKRPGKEPWAIFRFHYRTKESIEDNRMEVTYDAADKAPAKQDAHFLNLEYVPSLPVGSKPAGKNDGELSVRTSSPPPPDTPSTPTKVSKKSQSTQPKVVVRKQQTKPGKPATNPASEMAPTIDSEPAIDAEAPDMPDDLLGHQSTPTKVKDELSTAAVAETSDNTHENVSIVKKDDNGGSAAGTPKKVAKKAAKKANNTTSVDPETPSKVVPKKTDKKPDKMSDEHTDEAKDLDMANVVPPSLPVEASNKGTVPHPADIPSVFDTPTASNLTAAQTVIVPGNKDFIKSGSKTFTSPLKKSAAKLTPIDTSTSTMLPKPIVPPTPATPIKRAPEGTLTPPPDVKRIKTDIVPPLTPTNPRSLTSSPGPRSQTLEAQVAEQRKRLEAARKKRVDMASKKAEMDKKLAPYKQRLAEELERLRQEMAEEEALIAADEEEYMASEAMLAEYECGDGGF